MSIFAGAKPSKPMRKRLYYYPQLRGKEIKLL